MCGGRGGRWGTCVWHVCCLCSIIEKTPIETKHFTARVVKAVVETRSGSSSCSNSVRAGAGEDNKRGIAQIV